MVSSLGFRVWGLGCGAGCVGFGVWGVGFRMGIGIFGVWVLGLGCGLWVWALGFGFGFLGFEFCGLGLGVWSLGFGVWGLGFEVWFLGSGIWGFEFWTGDLCSGALRLKCFRLRGLVDRAFVTSSGRCPAKSAHVRQSRPDYGRGFQFKYLKYSKVLPLRSKAPREKHETIPQPCAV